MAYETPNGVRYDVCLSYHGGHFALYKIAKVTTKADLQEARQHLKRTRDVLSIDIIPVSSGEEIDLI